MKYSIEDYAKALASAVLEMRPGAEAAVKRNFEQVVQKNGDRERANKILDAASRLLRAQKGGREVVFESARPMSPTHRKALDPLLRPDDQAAHKVNPALVAGVRITIDGEYEFDGSLRGKLDKIFGNI